MPSSCKSLRCTAAKRKSALRSQQQYLQARFAVPTGLHLNEIKLIRLAHLNVKLRLLLEILWGEGHSSSFGRKARNTHESLNDEYVRLLILDVSLLMMPPPGEPKVLPKHVSLLFPGTAALSCFSKLDWEGGSVNVFSSRISEDKGTPLCSPCCWLFGNANTSL